MPVSLALGSITYVHAGGRLLAPLLASDLVVVGRSRWRWVLIAWLGFAATQIPLILSMRAHPGALARRFDATTFITDDMSRWEVGWRATVNYLRDLQLWHYVFSRDVKPYAHTPGAGALLAPSLILSVAGLVLVLARYRSDPFWRYAVAAFLVSPVSAAFTIDRFHAIRLAPFAVMLVVMAIPAADALREAAARVTRARVLVVVLVTLASLQLAYFVHNFTTNGPLRTGRFAAGVPRLLDRGWADGGTVYIDYDDREPQALARWYALMKGLDQSHVVRLPDGGIPPSGAIAFGRTQECDYVCARLEESGDNWIARVEGPPPG